MSSSSKSRKLSVFDRLGPEEDLSHVSFHFCDIFLIISRDTRGHLQPQVDMQVMQGINDQRRSTLSGALLCKFNPFQADTIGRATKKTRRLKNLANNSLRMHTKVLKIAVAVRTAVHIIITSHQLKKGYHRMAQMVKKL